MKLHPDEYQMAVDQMVMLASLASDIPIEDVLEAIDHADAVGPIVDPTLWMRGHKKMDEVKELAEAFLPFVRKARALKASLEANREAAEARAGAAVGAGR